jgi:hypothetical protein
MPTKYRTARKTFNLLRLEVRTLEPHREEENFVPWSAHNTMYGNAGLKRHELLKKLPEEAVLHHSMTIGEYYTNKLQKPLVEITYKDILKTMN